MDEYYVSKNGYYYEFDTNENKYKRISEDEFFDNIEKLANKYEWNHKPSGPETPTEYWKSKDGKWGLTLYKKTGDMHIKRKKNTGGHKTEMGCFTKDRKSEWRMEYKRKDFRDEMFRYLYSWMYTYGGKHDFFSCKK